MRNQAERSIAYGMIVQWLLAYPLTTIRRGEFRHHNSSIAIVGQPITPNIMHVVHHQRPLPMQPLISYASTAVNPDIYLLNAPRVSKLDIPLNQHEKIQPIAHPHKKIPLMCMFAWHELYTSN
jgi:hypothetical protein